MQAILAITVPFFALVLCGYLAARQHVLPASAVPGLNVFVLYFALPCLLFRLGAATPLLDLLNPAVLGVYLLAAGMVVFITIAATLGGRVPLPDAALGALVAAFPNSGFMGVPLLAALLGPAAAGPVISLVLADLFFTSSLCIGLAQMHGPMGHGNARGNAQGKAQDVAQGRVQRRRTAVLHAARGALSNPLPWAIALGGLFSVTGLVLPGPLDSIVAMLAAAATPVALFSIGAVLWQAGQQAQQRTPWADVLPVALIKLLLHPLLVFALGAGARQLGVPLSAFQLTVMTLTAALPSASNVSLLAQRYGADNGRIARIILSSTVLAFASFSLLAWAFGVRPG